MEHGHELLDAKTSIDGASRSSLKTLAVDRSDDRLHLDVMVVEKFLCFRDESAQRLPSFLASSSRRRPEAFGRGFHLGIDSVELLFRFAQHCLGFICPLDSDPVLDLELRFQIGGVLLSNFTGIPEKKSQHDHPADNDYQKDSTEKG